MPNAKDAEISAYRRVFLAGMTGSGKTAQIWTLKGRKFAYATDPNFLRTVKGLDIDYEEFMPDVTELDATIKGFNKGAKDDKPTSAREPTTYKAWVDDINERVDKGFFNDYDWLIFDSATYLVRSIMERQKYINNRYGGIEDLADYRVVGSKMTEVFNSIVTLPINMYMTGHISTFKDDKTGRVDTALNLPGNSRQMIPTMFTDVMQSYYDSETKKYMMRTKPDRRGLQEIRTTIPGLKELEDITIGDFSKAEQYGLGALLSKHK